MAPKLSALESLNYGMVLATKQKKFKAKEFPKLL